MEVRIVTIDTDAFLRDLHELCEIGRFRTGGHRPTYLPQDMESRRWLMARLEACGLAASIDGIGNVCGRHSGNDPQLLVAALSRRRTRRAGSTARSACWPAWRWRAGLPVGVCAFADEEGHFEGGFLGSRSFVGELDEAEIDRSRGRADGTPLRDALRAAGLEGRPRLALEEGWHRGFLEMHTEQGTQLESAALRLGVVSGIVKIWQWRLLVAGQQDHAGGTTMAERRDAGLAAVRLLAAIDVEFPRIAGERSTWTTGRIALDPGAPSIIPFNAEVLFQFRDISVPVLERMEQALRALVRESNRRERCVTTLEPVSRTIPAACDPALKAALARAAETLAPGAWQLMPSGAGHDAQVLARRMPAAMLFVPSFGGISH